MNCFSSVLEIAYENSLMHHEKQLLLEKWLRAESANRAGIVARDFAHEVKQNLRTINGWIKTNRGKDKMPDFAGIIAPVNKLDSYAINMLNKSDIKYIPAKCYINNIVKETLRSYGIKKDNNTIDNIPVYVDYSNYLWERSKNKYSVNIDPDKMISVLRNVINNSIEQYKIIGKIAPIKISTNIIEEPDEEDQIEILIEDYAGGVPLHIKRKMWDPFETGKPDGTGIGLYSVQKLIVERMEGTVDEIGTVGKGAIIQIQVPANKEYSDNDSH